MCSLSHAESRPKSKQTERQTDKKDMSESGGLFVGRTSGMGWRGTREGNGGKYDPSVLYLGMKGHYKVCYFVKLKILTH
jgi:hypothetical protein